MTSSTSDTAAAVAAVVDKLQPGEVTSYGEIAAVLGLGARQVGTAMRGVGPDAAWWRVVRADGSSHDPARSVPHWDEEKLRHNGRKVAMREHSIDRAELRVRLARGGDPR